VIRVLLDEDIPVKLRHHFGAEIHCETVQFRGWKGLRNGELLRLAQQDFDVLITLDSRIPSQQNLAQVAIGVMILRVQSNRFEDLLALVPEAERRLVELRPGESIQIEGRLPGPSSSDEP
jgi:hypothetical protein